MPEVRWLTPEEQRVWRAFLQASLHLFDQLDRELQAEVGIPMAYYQIMAMLSEAPDRTLRMSQLADITWSSRSRVSHAVDRLEEKEWVRRVRCPNDRRGAFAQLTPAGFAVLDAAAPSHVESVRRHLFDLLEPGQLEHLAQISQAVACPAAHGDSPGPPGGTSHETCSCPAHQS